MPHYKLYHLNSRSGHIDRMEDIVAADDRGAVRAAADRAGETPMELWCDGRKVKRFEISRGAFATYFADAPSSPA